MADYDSKTNTFSMSVRDITDFIYRDGDVSGDGYSSSEEKMLAGARFHRSYEARMEKQGFVSEYRMEYLHEYEDGLKLKINGIADLLKWNAGTKAAEIGEIKTVSKSVDTLDMDSIPKYKAQSWFYAHMFMIEKGINSVCVSLIFHNLNSKLTNVVKKDVDFCESSELFSHTLDALYKWLRLYLDHKKVRDESIAELKFPHDSYRKGQRELCAAVYRSVRDGEKLFAEAPTGTGKTVSALFPAIKAMGEGHIRKIFYLTAKVITRKVAKDAMADMAKGSQLDFRTIVLCAKSRSCLGDGNCLPHLCKYSKGHGERVNAALFDLISNVSLITPEIVAQYAEKYTVCPHELALDASLFCDAVVGDYNHSFDPRAMLQRYFSCGGDYAVLVDEAHNLPDRAREMYSSALGVKMLKDAARSLKGESKLRKLKAAFSKVAKEISEIGKANEDKKAEEGKVCVRITDALETALNHLCEEYRKFLSREEFETQKEKTVEAYFECKFFLKLIDFCGIYDNSFAVFYNYIGKNGELDIMCTDPSAILYDLSKLSKSTVFFSATLRPFDYYYDILGGSRKGDDSDEKIENTAYPSDISSAKNGAYLDKYIRIGSPFPKENLLPLAICGISTRFKDRDESYEKIANVIFSSVKAKVGNYMVFFPSFRYLECVYEYFDELCRKDGENQRSIKTMCQTSEMSEDERAEFLLEFESFGQNTLVGFCVCGGVFSEGVDLRGECLSGAIIIGTGMPGVCFERNLLRRSYDAKGHDGFDFAYTFPGLNRVFQAGGRVIRTETDRGFVLLIDDRYRYRKYISSFPEAWENIRYFSSAENVGKEIEKFFER